MDGATFSQQIISVIPLQLIVLSKPMLYIFPVKAEVISNVRKPLPLIFTLFSKMTAKVGEFL